MEGLESNQFKITARAIKRAITEKTRAVIINSPSNPTGVLYTEEELSELGKVCLEKTYLDCF